MAMVTQSMDKFRRDQCSSDSPELCWVYNSIQFNLFKVYRPKWPLTLFIKVWFATGTIVLQQEDSIMYKIMNYTALAIIQNYTAVSY